MPAFTAAAPGKIILAGEHAVVYGQPALAVPVFKLRARAVVRARPGADHDRVLIHAPDIGLKSPLDALDDSQPLHLAVELTRQELNIARLPALSLEVHSQIPMAAGLGSSAAVSTAVIRALSAFLGNPLADERVSALTYRVEQVHHGNPSGVDNTVITYGQPVYYRKDHPVELFKLSSPVILVIADTGIPSLTSETVSAVRRGREAEPGRYGDLFDQIGSLVRSVKTALERGDLTAAGPLLTENHRLLGALQVSSPELDQLVDAALGAGALGAKLSGGGGGGHMIALVEDGTQEAVSGILQSAGAVKTHTTVVRGQD